jgi:threonine dehydratase
MEALQSPLQSNRPSSSAQKRTVDRAGIAAVHETIAPYVRCTPVLELAGEPGLPPVTLKLESLQNAGSFKARGAFSNLLTRGVPAAGVVAASGGNHGAAVAFAARRLGVRAKIFVPNVSSPAKTSRIRAYGADLTITGDIYDEALAGAAAWAAATGALAAHAFDQVETMLGAGTVALELERQAPRLDTVLVPVGGGGLIAGVASWYAGTGTRVVGVEPEGAPTLTAAFAAGGPVEAPAESTAKDSLGPALVGELVFPIAQKHVERVVLVPDAAIVAAQERLWEVARIVAEPGGATAFAALASGAYRPAADERVGVLVSGGNTTAVKF